MLRLRIVSTAVLTLPAENDPNFLILLSKVAKIHVWNKLKLYKRAPISTQKHASELSSSFNLQRFITSTN